MDESYDAIVLGTGLKECIISGLLSTDGKKVLHLDRNDYYGGESASLDLEQFYKKFKGASPPQQFGRAKDYYIDQIPKYIMANGQLVKILLHCGVENYLDFKQADGSYVLRDSRIYKLPATDKEAIASKLMGLFEKRRCRNFFIYIQDVDENNRATWKDRALDTMTMQELFESFSLDRNTWEFIGHALALHTDDKYLGRPALDTVRKVKLYHESFARYGQSPYIYPLYGLGDLPQAFARLSAVYGGTYMLDTKIDEIVYENGVVAGVRSGDKVAKAPIVVGDPTYFPDKVEETGKAVRAFCLLNHPVPNTNENGSCQIIIPQRQAGRNNDIYVFVSSFTHNVAPKGMYIAIVSTTVETGSPEQELKAGLDLLGPVLEKVVDVVPTYKPKTDGKEERVFISKSYDATSHFESTTADVMDVYERITGHPLDLTKKRRDHTEQEQ
mmetsp:Transcript_36747/g.95144  ORF Transcript_36747/g.95144 Transcript_36747/m.95144 type:complete len:442 (-) Transcript_36747:905-2230(-)